MGVFAAVIVSFLIGVCFGVFGCAFWYWIKYEFPRWTTPEKNGEEMSPRKRRNRA